MLNLKNNCSVISISKKNLYIFPETESNRINFSLVSVSETMQILFKINIEHKLVIV